MWVTTQHRRPASVNAGAQRLHRIRDGAHRPLAEPGPEGLSSERSPAAGKARPNGAPAGSTTATAD
jgi:hypothetical protein